MNELPNDIVFEHQFWLQILGDHSRFIHQSHPLFTPSIIIFFGFRMQQAMLLSSLPIWIW